MNYGELIAAVEEWTKKEDYAAGQVELFIDFALSEIGAQVRHPLLVTIDAAFTGPAVPAGFAAPLSLTFGDTMLSKLTAVQYQMQEGGLRWKRRYRSPYYAVIGDQVVMSKTFADPGTFLYYKAPGPFSANSDTHPLLTAFPHLFVSLSNQAAFGFLHNEERAEWWEKQSGRSIAVVNKAGRDMDWEA